VAGEAFMVVDGEAADAQGYTRFEGVRVVAESDASIHGLQFQDKAKSSRNAGFSWKRSLRATEKTSLRG
jgi:hypothetical protein